MGNCHLITTRANDTTGESRLCKHQSSSRVQTRTLKWHCWGWLSDGASQSHTIVLQSHTIIPGSRGQRGLYAERSSRRHLDQTVQLRTNKLTGQAGSTHSRRGPHNEMVSLELITRNQPDGGRLQNTAQNHQPALLKINGKKKLNVKC